MLGVWERGFDKKHVAVTVELEFPFLLAAIWWKVSEAGEWGEREEKKGVRSSFADHAVSRESASRDKGRRKISTLPFKALGAVTTITEIATVCGRSRKENG